MLTDMYQLTMIPVFLIALAGWFFLRGEADRAGRHFLLFLLGVGVFLLLLVFLISPGSDDPYYRFGFELSVIVTPALIGILVSVVLYLKWFREMGIRARVTALLLMAAIVILPALLWNSRLPVSSMIVPGALILLLIWSLGWAVLIPAVIGMLVCDAAVRWCEVCQPQEAQDGLMHKR